MQISFGLFSSFRVWGLWRFWVSIGHPIDGEMNELTSAIFTDLHGRTPVVRSPADARRHGGGNDGMDHDAGSYDGTVDGISHDGISDYDPLAG